jgi:Ser/Thr protein kinase RdoA (MazF antagonist)
VIEASETAIAAWGGSIDPPRLISHRENAVFAVMLNTGQKAALRLHRPGYNSIPEIKSELWWTKQLAKAGFSVPAPIAATSGDLLVELSDGQVATVISWVEGRQIGESGVPLAGNLSDQIALYQKLGKLLAQLHTTSDALKLPTDFQRRNWNLDGFLGPDPLWGRFWENPALDAQTHDLLLSARSKAQDDLADYAANGADQGLIHADALRENVFCADDALSLIDFDDSGFGFRLYDLTVALSQSTNDQNFAHLKDAILNGYSQIRPIRQTDMDRFHLFVTLRSFASFGWVIPRLSQDDPTIGRYLQKVEWAARKYLDQD